ncbi:MAG: O-antigen ligase family protein [Alphaproteobacteria bacterium]|nr:O-antigen ligase family protein [Alphaproteobacteria bacterium]
MGLAPIVAAMVPRALSFLPGVILILGICGYFFNTRKRPLLSIKPLIYTSCVSLLCLISVLWSPFQEETLMRAGKIVLVLTGNGLLLSYILARPIERLRYFPLIFISAFFVGLALLANELFWDGAIMDLYHALTESTGDFKYSDLNRGIVAAALCTPAAFALASFTITDSYKRWAVYAVMALLLTFIGFLTYCQSYHVAMAVMIFFFFLFPVKREWAWLVLAMVLSALIFITPLMVQYLFHALPPLIKDIHWFQYSYALQRLEIWDYVSRYAMQNPLTGFGVEITRMVTFDTQELYQSGNMVLHPHNFAVQIWVEFGVVGATCASLFLLYLLDAMRKLPPLMARMCLASLGGCMAVGSTGYGIWQGWWLGTFILVAGYCLIVTKIYAARVVSNNTETQAA